LWGTWHCHFDSNLHEKPKFLSDSDILAPRRQERQVRKFILFLCGPFDVAQGMLCVFAGDNPNLGSGAHAKFFVLHASSQETQNSKTYSRRESQGASYNWRGVGLSDLEASE
jgi:hypothetical protein